MNRRSFLRIVCGAAIGVSVPFIPSGKAEQSPVAVLQHKKKVQYKGIDWRLSTRPDRWYAVQLTGEVIHNEEGYFTAMLFDRDMMKDDKTLQYYMDCIARRFKARIRK